MAYTGSALVRMAILGRGRSPMSHRHRPCAGFHLGDDAGGHRGFDDVVPAVVLAADPVQALHVNGVGDTYGRLRFGSAGSALGHGFHLE